MNIFVSRPTEIDTVYEKTHNAFENFLRGKNLNLKRLGANNYSRKAPLTAVMSLMDECKGAIILGYPHHEVVYSIKKSGKTHTQKQFILPTPWNQIEGTLAFKNGIPVLVIAQKEVEGGIFDFGITGEFVLKTDLANRNWFKDKGFIGLFKDWKKSL
jgi:hypothetical protein